MPANSSMRRAVKRTLGSFEGTPAYQLVQAGTVAWDIRTGAWDEPELDLLPLAIRPGESAIDVGANLGLWTHHISRAVGRAGRVFAFEPMPSTHATLRMVCKLLRLRNVELHATGCGERTERLAFVAPLQDSGVISSGLAHLAGRCDGPGNDGATRRNSEETWCDVVPLDQIVPPSSEIAFLKCDIEGAELLAFRGAEKLIAEHHPSVVCEITTNFLAGFGFRVEDVTDFFRGSGYGWYHYDSGQPGSLSEVVTIDDYDWHNYVFVHPSRLDRFRALLR